MKPTLLYIMDPLCGWCYGFSPVVMQLFERHKDEMDFRVIPGGMITGARVAPASSMSSYILQSYKRLEEMTGVTFGEPYLEMLRKGTEMLNSEPPCRALHVFSSQHPERIVEYTHQLQRALFLDGYSSNDPETYRHLARIMEIDADAFMQQWESEEARYGVQQEFQWVQAAGVNGFPCTVLQKGEEYYMLSQGYRPLEEVEAVMEKVRAA